MVIVPPGVPHQVMNEGHSLAVAANVMNEHTLKVTLIFFFFSFPFSFFPALCASFLLQDLIHFFLYIIIIIIS